MYTDLDTIPISYQDYISLPKYLYHATDISYLDQIAEFGLGAITMSYPNPTYNQGIFLAIDYQIALSYIEGGRWDDPCVLQIPTDILDRRLLYYDTNDYYTLKYLNGKTTFNSNITLFYKGIITDPINQINILDI